MRTHLLIATAFAFAATGCIVEHDVVREPTQTAQVGLPPPPPQDDADAPGEATAPPPVERNVDTQVFYDRLSPYGQWEYTPEYGRVWVPTVAANWHPYYYGHWVLTDWGWTFASDDPWGWAAYHYGSWGYGPSLGWYWVPGSVWAPAWVSWRYGGGFVTWCPIGPRGYVYGYSSPAWIAVREQHFTQPIATAAVSVHATAGIVQGAAPLAGPHATAVKGGSFGPPVARVAAATGQQLHPVSAAAAIGRPQARPMATGDSSRRTGSDSIRSPAPRASSGPSGSTAGTPAVRASQPAPAAGARGAGGIDRQRADAPAPRGLGGGRTPNAAPAPRGPSSGASAPRGPGSGAPAPRGLGGGGSSSSAPAPRGLGGGSARASGGNGAPRSSGGGASRPAPAPRNSGGGGSGGYHPAPAPAPAPAARPSSGGPHNRR